MAQLDTLAALGSNDAKVVLAYLYLQGALPTGIDMDRADELLREPASSGDPYALYVRGWIHFLRDKDATRAVACWVASEEKGFSPSALELGRFLSWDFPGRPPKYAEAIEKLKIAHWLGHKQAAGLMATLDAAGARGPVFVATAGIRQRLQYFKLYFWMKKDFFASHVFSRPLEQKRPFFRPEAWAQ